VAIDILQLLSRFENANGRESETAFFQTHVPWVAPLAYLNIIFKPAPNEVLSDVARRLNMPAPLIEFLGHQNGVILFSGALYVYGVHCPRQLLDRQDPFSRLPFNIELEDYDRLPFDPDRFLRFGGYGFDGSTVCIDRTDCHVYLFKTGTVSLLPNPSAAWHSIEEWLTEEITRLLVLFDEKGKRLVDESLTLPGSGIFS
jgi:hypothetical protein